MSMSKAHDEPSRGSEAQAPDAVVTPAPEIASSENGQGVKRREAPVGRRVRSGASRERSGPIGIASGDFATPSVRRRTTTQPRGTPAVGPPADLDPLLFPAAGPTPPAEPLPSGATPVDLVDAPVSGRTSAPPPVPADSPFGTTESAEGDLDSAAAVLAAEAAAVRAFDSGPMTPLPDVAPLAPAPLPDVAPLAPTPPPEVAEIPVVDFEATPPPEPHGTPPDKPAPDIAGALPVRPMGSEGSAASADLTTAGATPTPAPIVETESEAPGDEIEVFEGQESVAASTTSAPAAQEQETPRPTPTSPSPIRPPPPPIPGNYLKTPGPELRSPPPAGVEEAHGPLLPALPILPEALTQRPRRPKRSKAWFEEGLGR